MAFSMIISHPAIGLPPMYLGKWKYVTHPRILTMIPVITARSLQCTHWKRWMFHELNPFLDGCSMINPFLDGIFHELSLTKPSSYWVFPIYGTAFFRPGTEISAAHRAFWLPLSQQSETARTLAGYPTHCSVQRGKGMEKVWFGHAK